MPRTDIDVDPPATACDDGEARAVHQESVALTGFQTRRDLNPLLPPEAKR